MGMDAFNGLLGWHDWQSFPGVLSYPGAWQSGQRVDELVAAELDLDRRQVTEPHELFEQSVGKVHWPGCLMWSFPPQSAEPAREDGHVSGLLNPSVINYIEEHSLYGCEPQAVT